MVRMTSQLAERQRNGNRVWNMRHVTDIAAITARLRSHARRCKGEAGYRTDNSMSRSVFAAALRALAKKIDHRYQLGLSLAWWLEDARKKILRLDRLNP
jgi:hypothetical protein